MYELNLSLHGRNYIQSLQYKVMFTDFTTFLVDRMFLAIIKGWQMSKSTVPKTSTMKI